MAAAYMVLKQTPRARNQLKRVGKNNWTMTVSKKKRNKNTEERIALDSETHTIFTTCRNQFCIVESKIIQWDKYSEGHISDIF